MQEQDLIDRLKSLFNPECSLDVYYLTSALLEPKKFHGFMQAVENRIKQNIDANDPEDIYAQIIEYYDAQTAARYRHTQMVNQGFRRTFNEINGNDSLSPREKLQLVLTKIIISVHIAFCILSQEQRLLLYNLFKRNRALTPDRCALLYNRLISQTHEVVLTQTPEQVSPTNSQVIAPPANDDRTLLSPSLINLESVFVCSCPLDVYQLASVLDDNQTKDFMQRVHDQIELNITHMIERVMRIENKKCRIIFNMTQGNTSLSPKEKVQIVVSEVFFSSRIAFDILNQEQRSLLRDLFEVNLTLSEAELKQTYLQNTLPSREFTEFVERIQNLQFNQEDDLQTTDLPMPGINDSLMQFFQIGIMLDLQTTDNPQTSETYEPHQPQTQHDAI